MVLMGLTARSFGFMLISGVQSVTLADPRDKSNLQLYPPEVAAQIRARREKRDAEKRRLREEATAAYREENRLREEASPPNPEPEPSILG
jgi:hypothetical protein